MLNNNPTEPPPEDADTILIPVRNPDSRGGFDFNEEVGTPTYTTGYLPFPTSIARQGDVVIPIYGDSMEPTFKDGDFVLIRQQPSVENGQIAAINIDGETTLKHVYRYPGGIHLTADNPAYAPIYVPVDSGREIVIHGLAVGYTRLF